MTLPAVGTVLAGYPFLARRHGLDPWISEVAVRGALVDAAALCAGDESAEPAALFYAFARRPRATRGAWILLPTLLAMNQARAIGTPLRESTRGELRALATRITSRTIDFDGVRAWFESRLAPIDAP